MANRDRPHRADGGAASFVPYLGWFSIGLGLAELVAPRPLSGSIGLERRSGLFQAYGLREIATGLGILLSRSPAPWLWARVAGDALDLATMAPSLRRDNEKRTAATGAVAAVAAITLLDIYFAFRSTAEAAPEATKELRDYSRRSGFPKAAERMASAALRA